ncbi:MAG: 2OG-Fe(II) oxygenase [Candidatus Eremiobacteraeota bacterium]|nr:2OG-Fe(II) oxygenase [Candidatus Eremiobacteraeota bacterium]
MSRVRDGMKHQVATLDWDAIERGLFTDGYALVDGVLDDGACSELAAMYPNDALFRSRVRMEAHGFGHGQYRYFQYPLPPFIQNVREELYGKLSPIANRWMESLRLPDRFPATQQALFDLCEAHGQTRPTALLLTYEPGDWNALHQDLYGEIAFPFQATFFLSRPGTDFTGGEFVLVEQRPRAQSRPEVIVPNLGAMLIFANRYRPVQGKNGTYRTVVRHGVSRIRSGRRFALGVIFHDAK